MRIILLAMLLLLGGCASSMTKEQFSAQLYTWVGHSTDELQRTKGPPTSISPLNDGGKIFTYNYSQVVQSPATPFAMPGVGNIPGSWQMVPGRQSVFTCLVHHFANAAGIITSVTWQGCL